MEKLGWHTLGTAFDCDCGERHALPIEACYLGEDADRRLASFAHGRCGRTCLVVSDENTRAAAGEGLFSQLGMEGVRIAERIYPVGPLDATGERADDVAREGEALDFYVSVGAGTLCDLAKYAASKQNKPFLAYPTAASMNGYTSAIAALKVGGLKRTLPCQPATGVFVDPEIAAGAPARMTAAGVADFLSKASSSADWRAAHLLRHVYFCPRAREFALEMQERVIARAPAIGRGDVEAVRLVLEALLLSGMGMVVAGSSAPASGGEHLISHYIDMKDAIDGTGHDLHGTQVGVATVYALRLWERILAMRTTDIDPEGMVAAYPSSNTIRERIYADWGGTVGDEVWRQWSEKALDEAGLRAELESVRQHLPGLRGALLADLVPSETVARCIEEAGGPAEPAGLEVPPDAYHAALAGARFLRNRYTVLDLAAALGLA